MFSSVGLDAGTRGSICLTDSGFCCATTMLTWGRELQGERLGTSPSTASRRDHEIGQKIDRAAVEDDVLSAVPQLGEGMLKVLFEILHARGMREDMPLRDKVMVGLIRKVVTGKCVGDGPGERGLPHSVSA